MKIPKKKTLPMMISKSTLATLNLLDEYDKRQDMSGTPNNMENVLTEDDVDECITLLRQKYPNTEAGKFKKACDYCNADVSNLTHYTISGKPLHPTIENCAADLFYDVVKNHYLVDGNKRLAVLVTNAYLQKNSVCVDDNRSSKLSPHAWYRLAVMTAKSDRKEMVETHKFIEDLFKG